MITILLSFFISDFAFANLLVGIRFEALLVHLYNKHNDSGHFTSALVIFYFLIMLPAPD
ncbi:MAG: hypothetical protein ACSLEL_04575 [Candidatus Malihini olakiniferum]